MSGNKTMICPNAPRCPVKTSRRNVRSIPFPWDVIMAEEVVLPEAPRTPAAPQTPPTSPTHSLQPLYKRRKMTSDDVSSAVSNLFNKF